MPRRPTLLFTALAAFFALSNSCTSGYLRPKAYVEYIRDPANGFVKRESGAGLLLEAAYEPPEYVALAQSPTGKAGAPAFAAALRQASLFHRFMLTVTTGDGKPIDEVLKGLGQTSDSFGIKKQEMIYRSQGRFFLSTGGDSLPCVFCHVENTGKMSNAYRFILAFEPASPPRADTLPDDLRLAYADPLWLRRQVSFVFDKEDINRSPKLKL